MKTKDLNFKPKNDKEFMFLMTNLFAMPIEELAKLAGMPENKESVERVRNENTL